MEATAIVYDIKNTKGKGKTYLIRKVFGYKDFSNNRQYTYNRKGILGKYILQKWGKSVIIIDRKKERTVFRILNRYNVAYQKIRITLGEK